MAGGDRLLMTNLFLFVENQTFVSGSKGSNGYQTDYIPMKEFTLDMNKNNSSVLCTHILTCESGIQGLAVHSRSTAACREKMSSLVQCT